jgi:hypothetical protein
LYLRARATGGRSWVLRRKRGGQVEVITVGAWPALGLAESRLKAGALAGKEVSTLTLGALLDACHTDIVRRTYRRPREVRGYIDRLDPALKATKLRNLERVEVRHALQRYAEERLRRLCIPKEHSKNHRAHWVALSRQALALLRGEDQSRELIFGTATDTGVQSVAAPLVRARADLTGIPSA